MGAKVSVNIAKFKEELKSTAEALNKATRPAAQAGAQIIYDRARYIVASELVSEKPHMFYGTHAVYGPYKPLTLFKSIYQVFSEDNSFKDVSTYHVSWNADKAPYGAMLEFGTGKATDGAMVEFGTSKAPAHSFIRRAIVETRAAVRKAIKQRYLEEVSKR